MVVTAYEFYLYISYFCRNEPPKHMCFEELERKYWKNITFNAPLYGADVCGSITDESCDSWNINRLGSILDFVNQVIQCFAQITF